MSGARREGRGGPVIETTRLFLREMTMADLDDIAAMLADRVVMRFWPAPLTRTESALWIGNQIGRYSRDGCGYWLAIGKESGDVAGQAGVLMTEIEGEQLPALGYVFHRRFWGRGIATEAAAACRDFVFQRLCLPRAYTAVRPENVPSLRVAEKIGMKPERTVMYAGCEHVLLSVRVE